MNKLKVSAFFVCMVVFVALIGAQAASAAGMSAMDDKATGAVKQLWEQYKNKDSKTFSASLTDDAMEVAPDGTVRTKAQILEQMAGDTVTEYNLTDWHVQWLDKDTALVHYTATAKGTMKDGKPFPEAPIHCTDALVNKGGKWLAAFHQETAIMAAKP
jgi:ketosteroid isomerase-like protein